MEMKSNVIRLNCGINLPILGLGTYSYPFEEERTEIAVQMALKMGYRHFDTAKIYGSEPAVGRALRNAIINRTVDREEIFVTSKLWGSDHHDPVSALKQTLENMQMEYLDLYLVHWPIKLKPWSNYPVPEEEEFDGLDMETTWAGMEKCVEMGLCKSIGLSNFSALKIQRVLDFASVLPAVNQVEMHPKWRQAKLRKFCGDQNIHVSAYSPLGGPGTLWGSKAILDNPIIQSIAHKHKATSAQVALQWGISQGSSVIAKSFNQDRLDENMGAIDLELDDYDVQDIEQLEESKLMRGDFIVNETTSPYKTLQDLWDEKI